MTVLSHDSPRMSEQDATLVIGFKTGRCLIEDGRSCLRQGSVMTMVWRIDSKLNESRGKQIQELFEGLGGDLAGAGIIDI